MTRFLLSLLCLVGTLGFAQQKRGERDIKVKDSPAVSVSFIWNQYHPQIFNATDFSLYDGGNKIDFSFRHLDNPNIPHRNKTVLFLWENLPYKKKEFDFAQSLLYYFLTEKLANKYPDDILSIAVFNRIQPGKPLLTQLSEFSNDNAGLAQKVALYTHAEGNFSNPDQSDLFVALTEGLNLLSSTPPDNNIKVIFIITNGVSTTVAGAKREHQDIIVRARGQEIPIYVIKYNTNERQDIKDVARRSCGDIIVPTDVNDAMTKLFEMYQNIDKRHYGQDYEFTFESPHEKDGQQYTVSFKPPRTDMVYQISYITPKKTLGQKILDNWFVILLTIVLLGGFTFFGIRYFKKKRSEDEKRDKERDEKYQEKIKDVEYAKSQIQQESEERKKAWQAHQQQMEEEQKRAKEKELEEQRLNLMHTKNLFPRLQCVVSGSAFTYHVQKSVTTIGRNDTNDLILADGTVSGSHAKMVFNGSGFEIHDLKSTNKVIVNGNFTEQATLRSGDIIGLGEVIITFYI